MGSTALHSEKPKRSARLDLARVAAFPPPGTLRSGSFRFTHDGHHLYYLSPEGEGTARALVREEVETGSRQVVGRPDSGSGQKASLSHEEILRRERLRIRETGITQFVVAARADVVVYAFGSDLWLAQPGREPLRLTETPAAEVDPQLSRDGRRLGFVREGELYVMDLASRAETRLTQGATDSVTHGLAEYIAQEEMGRPSGFWWSPDGERLAYTEVDETAIPVYPIVHQGEENWEVDNFHYPFAGGKNAKVRLGVIPASGGATLWLSLALEGEEIYLARVLWEPGGGLLVQTESRDQKSLRLLRFDPETGSSKILLEDRSDSWINLHDDLTPLDGGRFLWSSESSGYRHLELHSRDGSLVRRLTSGDWPVDKIEAVDETGGWVFFSAAKDGPLERHLYRVSLEGGTIERLTPEAGFHVPVLSRDGRWFVDVRDSAASAPLAVLKDRSGRTVRLLESADDKEVRALALRPPTFVTVKAEDGTVLHGALYVPPAMKEGRRHPAIVRVYGGPTAQEVKDSWALTQDLRAQYLARQGYVVFRLDNRGSPRRGRAFESAILGRLGSVEVQDQIAGARYLARLPYVDGSRIGIYGWSYGGYMAARCMLEAPELFRAGVAGAPVTDWDGYDTHYTERYMGRPQDNVAGYRGSSLLPLAARLKGSLLLIHGMIDENVHFRHTARLMNALNAAQAPYDTLIFPEERHLPRRDEDRVFMEQRLLDHFDRHLKRR
jgi:dipeptidyl-peptidase-4